jgi:hypothetical protein
VTLVRKADKDKNHDFFFRSFGVKKINEFVETRNTLTNNFASFVTSDLGPDVACGP